MLLEIGSQFQYRVSLMDILVYGYTLFTGKLSNELSFRSSRGGKNDSCDRHTTYYM